MLFMKQESNIASPGMAGGQRQRKASSRSRGRAGKVDKAVGTAQHYQVQAAQPQCTIEAGFEYETLQVGFLSLICSKRTVPHP